MKKHSEVKSQYSNHFIGWMPNDPIAIEKWSAKIRKLAEDNPRPLIEPIADFQEMVYADPVLYANVQGMLQQVAFVPQIQLVPSGVAPIHTPEPPVPIHNMQQLKQISEMLAVKQLPGNTIPRPA